MKRVVVERNALLGKYRLLELLGTGGMAEVWKAKIEGPAGFERVVVVKRVLPHLARDASFVDMFLAEARLSALLIHPNIVQVFELGTIDGEYFMAMEFVDGADLGQLMREDVFPPVGIAASIVQSVCRALGHAHEVKDASGKPLGLVHRDVTPSNVLIGRDGTVHLLDFGIAKALSVPSERLTDTGTLKGKRGYMAPEQIRGGELDHRLDVFAAGVVLHELLTHRRLFKGANDFESFSNVLSKEIPDPSLQNPDVPPGLGAVCLRALSRDRDERFPTADAFADALEPYAIGFGAKQIQRTFAPHFTAAARSAVSATLSAMPHPALDPDLAPMTTPDLPSHVPGPSRRRSVIAAALVGLVGVSIGGAVLTSRSKPPVVVTSPKPEAKIDSPKPESKPEAKIDPPKPELADPEPDEPERPTKGTHPAPVRETHAQTNRRRHPPKPTAAVRTEPAHRPEPTAPARRPEAFDPDSARGPH